MHDPFVEHPVLGAKSEEQITNYLRLIGADDEIPPRSFIGAAGQLFGRNNSRDAVWRYTNHHFGFISAEASDERYRPIVPAGTIEPDHTLKGTRIKVTLDKLRVAKYPGKGEHSILFDFFGRNQLQETTEDLHFNATYRAPDGDSAGINGYPIFVGLTVGGDGVAFRCSTVNVASKIDKGLAAIFDSDVFKQGLKLTTAAQPALAPFVTMAQGVTKSILSRSENERVQEFSLGLDFASSATSAKLREGSFVVVQGPDDAWSWNDWVYDIQSSRIVLHADASAPCYNYIIFGISRAS